MVRRREGSRKGKEVRRGGRKGKGRGRKWQERDGGGGEGRGRA